MVAPTAPPSGRVQLPASTALSAGSSVSLKSRIALERLMRLPAGDAHDASAVHSPRVSKSVPSGSLRITPPTEIGATKVVWLMVP